MKLNAANPHFFSFRAKFHCAKRQDTVDLGRSFAAVVALENRDSVKEPVRSVGLIAPMGTGKSSLLAGIHQGLEDGYNFKDMAMLAMRGVNDNISQKGGLVRHFDLCVYPDREDWPKPDAAMRPSHEILSQGMNKTGLELVEHANLHIAPRFDYIFHLRAQSGTSRTVSVYTSAELAGEQTFQTFLADNAHRRAKPYHYALDVIDRLYPSRDVWSP